MSIVLTGARVVLYINGALFGRVMGFRFSANTPRKEIRGIDSNQNYEIAPTTAGCDGSISVIRLVGDGGAEGAGMIAAVSNLSREKYFTILLLDRGSDTTIFKADQCSVMSQSWEMQARGIVTGTISFKAINWSNEVTG